MCRLLRCSADVYLNMSLTQVQRGGLPQYVVYLGATLRSTSICRLPRCSAEVYLNFIVSPGAAQRSTVPLPSRGHEVMGLVR